MAKSKSPIALVGQDEVLKLASDCVALNVAGLRALPQSEVNGRGIVLANERLTFRPTGVMGLNGLPAEFTVQVSVTRAALTDSEQAAIDKAATDQKTRQDARKLEEQSRRDGEMARATEITRENLVAGIKLGQSQNGDIASQVSSAIGLVNALSGLIGTKSLTSGQ